jgi:hypothetical protein
MAKKYSVKRRLFLNYNRNGLNYNRKALNFQMAHTILKYFFNRIELLQCRLYILINALQYALIILV